MAYSIKIERDRIAPVLDYLARDIVSRRNTIPQLSMVELAPDPGGLRIRATSLDVWASVQLPGIAEGEAGAVLAGAHVLRDFVKRQPRGSLITMSWDSGERRVSLVCGQARSSIGGECQKSFPATPEVAGRHVFTLPNEFGPDLELVAPFASEEDQSRPWLCGVALERFAGGLAMAATDGFGMSAATYPLPRGADDLPGVIIDRSTIGALRGAIKLQRGQPVDIRIDRALVALTVGAVEIVARPIVESFPRWENIFHGLDDLAPIALPEIDPSIPVRQLVRMKRAHGKADLIWQGNGYISLVTRADNDRWAGVVMHNPDAPTKGFHADGDTYELDGVTRPLRTKGGIIELTADQVRAMCGPVDPSTFVEIPASACYQGQPVRPGAYIPTPPKIDARDALSMSAEEMADYAMASRPIAVPVEQSADASATESAPLSASQPVEVSDLPESVAPMPVAAKTEPVAAIETVTEAPKPAEGMAEVLARLDALERVVASRPAVAVAAPVNDNAQPRERTERERRAIMRAWRLRGERRAERLDHAATLGELVIAVGERDAAIARADAMAAKRRALHATLQQIRAKGSAMMTELAAARDEARSAVSAMAVLTERWAAVQARRDEPAQPWMLQGQPRHLVAGHA